VCALRSASHWALCQLSTSTLPLLPHMIRVLPLSSSGRRCLRADFRRSVRGVSDLYRVPGKPLPSDLLSSM